MTFLQIICVLLLQFSTPQSGTSQPATAIQETETNVAFKFGFGAIVGQGDKKKFVSITKDTIIRSGDEMKLCVEPMKPCFIYVISQSSNGEVNMLFPYTTTQFTMDYKVDRNYYIPQGKGWFTVDKVPGKEVFHILASATRLESIEKSFMRYETGPKAEKATLAAQVINDIREVRKQFRSYATIGERPISIGGNVRGTAPAPNTARRPDVSDIAIEITANNFYVKTITLDHK
jgi:hypothetical protein